LQSTNAVSATAGLSKKLKSKAEEGGVGRGRVSEKIVTLISTNLCVMRTISQQDQAKYEEEK